MNKLPEKKSGLRICGIMTGTSCDGIDFATIDFNENGWLPIWEASREFPKKLRDRVLKIQIPGSKTTLKETFELNRDLGLFYSESLAKILANLEQDEMPHAIALHGQTVGHFPNESPGFTIQLGDPTHIVQKTGLTTISHFREGDLASHGQGAPLATPYHVLMADMLDGEEVGVAIVNIGGISNFSYIGPKGKVLASDTGPGCALIDRATVEYTKGKKTFDEYGNFGKEGVPHEKSLLSLLKNPYFKKKFPKTTGRDDFHWEYVLKNLDKKVKGKDCIATLSQLTILTLYHGLKTAVIDKKLPLRSVYICGGGSKNLYLMDELTELFSAHGVSVLSLDETEFSTQHIEAQAFAYLGYRTLKGLPLGGEFTGVKGFGAPGWITPGLNWNQILESLKSSF